MTDVYTHSEQKRILSKRHYNTPNVRGSRSLCDEVRSFPSYWPNGKFNVQTFYRLIKGASSKERRNFRSRRCDERISRHGVTSNIHFFSHSPHERHDATRGENLVIEDTASSPIRKRRKPSPTVMQTARTRVSVHTIETYVRPRSITSLLESHGFAVENVYNIVNLVECVLFLHRETSV